MALSTYTQPSTVSSSDTLSATDHNSEIVESIKHIKGVLDSYTVIVHEETSGTDAGTATATTYNIRPLTSIKANTNAANLVSINAGASRFSLLPGVWDIDIEASAFYTSETKLFLYNVTDAGYESAFISQAKSVGGSARQTVRGSGIIKTTAVKTFEVRMYCTRTQGTNGLGSAMSLGSVEQYMCIRLICIDKD